MEPFEMGIVGGVVIVALGSFKLIEKFVPKKNNPNGNKVMAKQVDEIHDWYGPKGPMDRMTTQMEAVNDNTKATTGVLEKILIVLEKKD